LSQLEKLSATGIDTFAKKAPMQHAAEGDVQAGTTKVSANPQHQASSNLTRKSLN
jgi:hypothetical protein